MLAALGGPEILGVSKPFRLKCALWNVLDAVKWAVFRIEGLQEIFSQPKDVPDRAHVQGCGLKRHAGVLLDPGSKIFPEAIEAVRRDMNQQMGAVVHPVFQHPNHSAIIRGAAAPLAGRPCPPAISGPDLFGDPTQAVLAVDPLQGKVDRDKLVERRAELLSKQDRRPRVTRLTSANVGGGAFQGAYFVGVSAIYTI